MKIGDKVKLKYIPFGSFIEDSLRYNIGEDDIGVVTNIEAGCKHNIIVKWFPDKPAMSFQEKELILIDNS